MSLNICFELFLGNQFADTILMTASLKIIHQTGENQRNLKEQIRTQNFSQTKKGHRNFSRFVIHLMDRILATVLSEFVTKKKKRHFLSLQQKNKVSELKFIATFQISSLQPQKGSV